MLYTPAIGNGQGEMFMTCKKSLFHMSLIALICLGGVAAHAQLTGIWGTANNQTQGAAPYYVTLIQATDGNFYGTMYDGGLSATDCDNYVNCGGVVFKYSLTDGYTLLYTFCVSSGCPDGRSPAAGLVQANDGNFYGTTYAGGTYNDGTIFRITPDGVLTSLHSFCNPPNTCNPNDGSGPEGQLLQASNGALYGVTTGNTLFKITTAGKFTLLYSFPNGSNPTGSLIQDGTGDLYGTTLTGGNSAEGSVFKSTLAGNVSTVYSFCPASGCLDGEHPQAGVTLSGGVLYGVTAEGGSDDYGTVFKVTTAGKFTSLHTFTGVLNGGHDGGNPLGPLVLATNGNLYGTSTTGGGPDGSGSVFEISSSDAYTNLATFVGNNTTCLGNPPYGGLMQSTNGTFYGVQFGSTPCQTAAEFYEYDIGLGPFVTTIPSYGKVGAKIIIQGSDLTGATKVTFNGTSATFTVDSATEITATVPTGATKGTVVVTTPSGTLDSNTTFTVTN
jgi:uncharacterized repeat protein (TIGR03803 family)